MYKCYLTWCSKKLSNWSPPAPISFVLSRNGNGLKPASLTAITTPPAASSPGLVPLTLWQWTPPCLPKPLKTTAAVTLQTWRSHDSEPSLVLESRIPEPWCERGSPSVFSVLMWPHEEFLFTHSCPRDVFCVHQVSPRLRTYYATTDLIQLWSFNTQQELFFLSNTFSSDLHQ